MISPEFIKKVLQDGRTTAVLQASGGRLDGVSPTEHPIDADNNEGDFASGGRLDGVSPTEHQSMQKRFQA